MALTTCGSTICRRMATRSTTSARRSRSKSDLADILARWQNRKEEAQAGIRTDQSFLVPKAEIAGNDYDLSINRYKEVVVRGGGVRPADGDPGSGWRSWKRRSRRGVRSWRGCWRRECYFQRSPSLLRNGKSVRNQSARDERLAQLLVSRPSPTGRSILPKGFRDHIADTTGSRIVQQDSATARLETSL